MSMDKLEKLQEKFDELQSLYGSKNLNSIYGCGCRVKPKVALVFMNPTAKNIASKKGWSGLKAQWLGTKPIWKFLVQCGLFDENLYRKIELKKPADWTPEFCCQVYENVSRNGVWITNLAKCTQDDARTLSDSVFLKYKDLLCEELEAVDPEKIIFFGNQVSSIMLCKNISVSEVRRQKFIVKLAGKDYDSYAVYYPVGNGRFNQPKAVEDLRAILSLDKPKKFLTVYAVLDDETQQEFLGLQNKVLSLGFTGTQTMGIPFHVSLGTFPLDDVERLKQKIKSASTQLSEFEFRLIKVGNFNHRVLFIEPEINSELKNLHSLFEGNFADGYAWHPHITVFCGDDEQVVEAEQLLKREFKPGLAKIVGLELGEFFPTKIILSKNF